MSTWLSKNAQSAAGNYAMPIIRSRMFHFLAGGVRAGMAGEGRARGGVEKSRAALLCGTIPRCFSFHFPHG